MPHVLTVHGRADYEQIESPGDFGGNAYRSTR